MAIQFLLYTSPIVYSLAAINEKVRVQFQTVYMLKPLASLTELFRLNVFGVDTLSSVWIVYSVVIAIVTFIAGAFAFHRVERGFADAIK